MRILIWGTGEKTKEYLQTKEIKPNDVIGFIESNPRQQEFSVGTYNGKIYKADNIKELKYDYVLVCVWVEEFIREIICLCIKLDLLDKRIIFMRNICGIGVALEEAGKPIYYNKDQDNSEIKKVFPIFEEKFMDHWKKGVKVFTSGNEDDSLGKSVLQRSGFEDYTYYDYFRYRTFEFVAKEIKKRRVDGNIAEVGVSRGKFSRLMNQIFFDKILYMFDTFDSFDKKEFDADNSLATENEEFYNSYRGIDVEEVLKTMPYKEKCIIRKGFFPSTAIGLEDLTYAFVSIDVDLENSIYNSLVYFYPRLNRGGAIFVHDYNCYMLEGVSRAIQRYEEELGEFLFKVPLADRGGTLVIVK